MRIALDARPLSHPQVGGFRTYVRALVHGLTELHQAGEDCPEEILLYLDRPLPADAPALAPNMQVRLLDRDRLRADWLLFPKQVRRDRPDLVHGTTNCLPARLAAPVTVTIHDAIHVKRYPFIPPSPNRRARLMGRYEAFLMRLTARKARRIVTISALSSAEIQDALPQARGKVTIVHNGILVSPPPTALPARSADIVLAQASTDPRKNFDLLLRALAAEGQALSPTPRLQIVCTNATSEAYVREAAGRLGLGGIDLLRGLSDQALATRFAEAAAFVFPSRMEGFGLPPLEAMTLGCPVLSSSAAPMPEILGDAPVWFDPDSPQELGDGLRRVLADANLRREMTVRGQTQAAKFTCRRMAAQTVAVWKSALLSP